jgi:hypothetical protein
MENLETQRKGRNIDVFVKPGLWLAVVSQFIMQLVLLTDMA